MQTKSVSSSGSTAVTYITAGKYKAMGNLSEPLNKEYKAYIQDHIDRICTIFIDVAVRYRGVDSDKPFAMADGKVFLAKKARQIGLIDRVEESLETFLSRMKKRGGIAIALEYSDLQGKHPDLFARVMNEGKAVSGVLAKGKWRGLARAVEPLKKSSQMQMKRLSLMWTLWGE